MDNTYLDLKSSYQRQKFKMKKLQRDTIKSTPKSPELIEKKLEKGNCGELQYRTINGKFWSNRFIEIAHQHPRRNCTAYTLSRHNFIVDHYIVISETDRLSNEAYFLFSAQKELHVTISCFHSF